MPKTDKQIAKRKVALGLYEKEIDELYIKFEGVMKRRISIRETTRMTQGKERDNPIYPSEMEKHFADEFFPFPREL